MKHQRQSLAIAIASALALPALSLSSLTQAEGLYVSAQVGISQQINESEAYGNNIAIDPDFPSEFDTGDGNVGAISLGYSFNKNLRIEGRIAYRDTSFNDRQVGTGERAGEEYILNGEFKSTTFTVEGFYDFANSTAFTPYVKAGLGIADNTYTARLGGAGVAGFDPFDGKTDGYYDAYADDDSTELSWNLGAGANIAVSERVSIYGEYQYASFGDVSTGQDSFTDGFKIDNASANELSLGLRFEF
ncbi:outer membrane protein [Agaribacterium sp. ZY112]|uniref:outer membrane protein n=1 Tax=Agaribacterium sp. ZY112 TaxID=3233574 RepID=UPI003525A0D9